MVERKLGAEKDIKDLILFLVKKRHPNTIEDLILLVQKERKATEEEIFRALHELEDSKRLQFFEPIFPISSRDFVFSTRGLWYWAVLVLSAFSVASFLLVSGDDYPFVYLRNALGIIFVMYLPGYSLVKVLFPVRVPLQTRSITIDSIERIVLSLGMSIAITPLICLLFYYTPIGFNLAVIIITILIFTLASATYGVSREYEDRQALRRYRKNMAYFKS